ILAFFLIKDGRELRDNLVESVPAKYQFQTHQILHDLPHLLSQYLRALLILSMVAFLSYSTFLSLTCAPYSILLAGIAGFLEFIPAAGPVVGGAVLSVGGLFCAFM